VQQLHSAYFSMESRVNRPYITRNVPEYTIFVVGRLGGREGWSDCSA
jgi:hypothetical protein